MASYTSPSENLPIFDNSVFTTTTSSSGFTYDELLDLFLSYPVAQGEQTIASLISNEIDTNLPTTNFNFLDSITSGQVNIATGVRTGALNINNNVSSSNTISIGNTLVTTNITGIGTIKANDFDVVSNSQNVGLFDTTTSGTIDIAVSQTTGILNIGTAVRTTTGSGGAINIGTNASSTAPINFGSASTPINFNNDITLTKNNYITTTASATAFTAPSAPLQVGCVVTGSSISTSVPTTNQVTSFGSITLKAGTWVITVNRQVNTIGGTSKILFAFGSVSRSNAVVDESTDYLYGVSVVTLPLSGAGVTSFHTIASITGGGDVVVYFNFIPTYSSAPASSTGNFRFVATRIA